MMSRLSIAVLALVLVFSACKKKSSDPEPEPAPTTTGTPTPVAIDINHNPIAEYDADGQTYTHQNGNGKSGGMGSSGSLASSSTGTSAAYYESYYYNNSGNYTYFAVEKGTIYTPGIGRPDEAAFRQFFATGACNYATTTGGNPNGIVIEHRDNNGVTWKTNKGTADQTGSSFNIVSNNEVDNFGDQQMKIYATFNCKVYDDNGNSKTLTNGKFVGYFENM